VDLDCRTPGIPQPRWPGTLQMCGTGSLRTGRCQNCATRTMALRTHEPDLGSPTQSQRTRRSQEQFATYSNALALILMNTALMTALGRDRSGPARVVVTKPPIARQNYRPARLECVILAVLVDRAVRNRNKCAPRGFGCPCGIERRGI